MRAGQTTAPSGATAVPAPLVLGRYHLCRRLGAGAFGTVWLARDERLERDVAVKILPRERVLEGRFEREARAAAALAHPAIVTLYEAAADDEGAYLVSELVRGTTLGRVLSAGRLSDRGILAVGSALCDALEHAHGQGIVHRDVKPSNILIPARVAAAGPPAKLTDFGIARVLGGDALTRTGELVGTAAYMAPEQAEGREVGAAADLYSLAIVLYEALTGINPIALAGASGPRARRLALHLPPLRRQRRELPRELGQAIDLALRPRARERGTLEELRRGLLAAAEQVADVPGVVAPPRLSRDSSLTERAPEPPLAPRTEARTRPTRLAGGATRPAGLGAARALEPRGIAAEIAPPGLQAPRAAAAPVPVRALAALLAAALAAWIAGRLMHPPPVPPAGAGLLAAIAVTLLPRVGWLALSGAAALGLGLQGRPGLALLLGLAALAPVLVLPRRGSLWPVAALAPALAVVGLGAAWPALAARAGTPWRRAALGAVGWCWLCLGSVLAGRTLYVHHPPGLGPASLWASSLPRTSHHALSPLLAGGLPAGAAVWALGAVALALVPLRRSAALAAFGALLWALAVTLGTGLALAARGGGMAPGSGAQVVAVVVGTTAALAPRLLVARPFSPDRTAGRLDLRSMGQP